MAVVTITAKASRYLDRSPTQAREAPAVAGASAYKNLETINAPLARRGIYLESLQLRLSRLPRLKHIGERILIYPNH